MKKRIFGAALLIAIAVTAGWNFNQSKNEVVLSELALANIEAIAQGELQSGVDADTKDCYREWVGGMGGGYVYVCKCCLLYTSPSPRDSTSSRMPSSA